MAKKWVDKFTNRSKLSDRMVVIKVLVQWIVISVISVYAPQCGFDHSCNIVLPMLLECC